jgi:hypothetical protein
MTEHLVELMFLIGTEDGEEGCVRQAIDFLIEKFPDMALTDGPPKVDRRGPFARVTVSFASDSEWRPE